MVYKVVYSLFWSSPILIIGKANFTEMYFKQVFILSFIFFASVSARSIREVASNQEAPSILNLFETINENFKKFGDTVSKSFNAQKFEESGRDVAKQLDEWGANIKKETENLKDNEAVKSLRESVDKALEEIKQSPDVKVVLEKYKTGADAFLVKINKIKETEEPKLQGLSQKILEQTTTTLQDIANIFQQDVKQ
ncbi:uncharacterized protein [Bactrocera oleae]|uniref:uncharacterized protein n=1 Tax=Bactrocera oleae TaxID=104688 RepID=UPI0006B8416A|nr:uncharacterized protein LOC106625113 [Bactrocera oleae]XP_036230014.1 uncharacterized protein LOC106625113 [Bactrocera oleae]XP_036230015.1 uncharacterized protein LOC106625113 [Bactrocera oleae]